MDIALQGELGGFTLTDVLMFIAGISKSGVLVITSPDGRLEVDVCDGSIAAARIDGGADDRVATAEALATGAGWNEGGFSFLLSAVGPGLAMPVDGALAEARVLGEVMRDATGRLGPPEAIPFRSTRLPGNEAVLTRDQWMAVAMADGTRTLRDIVATHPGGRLAAWAALAWLAEVGLVTSDLVRRPEMPPPGTPAILVGPATPALPEPAAVRSDDAFVDRLLEVHRSE